MPLDSFVLNPAISMQVVGAPDEIPPVVAAFQKIIDGVADNPARVQGIERFEFYDRAKESYAIIQTGETRLYGNLLLKKGIISPD
jgi:L-fucose mutarotase